MLEIKLFLPGKKFAQLPRRFEVLTPIHSDFMQSDRYLPPGIKFAITFTRNTSQAFPLMSNTAGCRCSSKI